MIERNQELLEKLREEDRKILRGFAYDDEQKLQWWVYYDLLISFTGKIQVLLICRFCQILEIECLTTEFSMIDIEKLVSEAGLLKKQMSISKRKIKTSKEKLLN